MRRMELWVSEQSGRLWLAIIDVEDDCCIWFWSRCWSFFSWIVQLQSVAFLCGCISYPESNSELTMSRSRSFFMLSALTFHNCCLFMSFFVWLQMTVCLQLSELMRKKDALFQIEMQRFTAKIVDMMKQEKLYASQGGPIILSQVKLLWWTIIFFHLSIIFSQWWETNPVFCQIENEYGNVASAYGSGAKPYVNWAATMATSLDTGVPWVMCQQEDAPDPIVSFLN